MSENHTQDWGKEILNSTQQATSKGGSQEAEAHKSLIISPIL